MSMEPHRPRGRDNEQRNQGPVDILATSVSILPRVIRFDLLEFRENANSRISSGVRFAALRILAQSCRDSLEARGQCSLSDIEKLSIGSRFGTHPMCFIDATGGITFGSDISNSHHTTVLSTTQTWGDPWVSIREQPGELKQTLGDGTGRIRVGCRILAGVIIGSGSIVAAGTVVTKDVLKNYCRRSSGETY